MTNQQNIATAQQKFVIQIDDKTLNRIKPHDRAELVQVYLQLFSGFSWVNWTNGHSLGRAWQTAITQCGAFCESKNKKNPAAKYLNAAYNGHKKYWSQIIMTHQNRENTINQKDEHIKKLREHGMRMIRQAMDRINLILARYNEYTLEISRGATATMENAASAPAPAHQPQGEVIPVASYATPAQRPVQHMQLKQAQAAEIVKQNPQVQQTAQVQRVAQPVQMKQVATAQRRPAVQQTAQVQRVVQPVQMKQVATAQRRPAVQQTAQVQRANVMQKRPYVKPMAQVVREKKPYVAPQTSVCENQFAKQAKQAKTATQTKVASMLNAQQKVQRMNMFMFGNFNQRAA